jgi:DNA polymerase-3 subunit delta
LAKSKEHIPSILEAKMSFSKDKFLPVYFFFGNDSFSIDETVGALIKAINPHVGSDFDKETFYGDDINLPQMLSMASSFPFGAGRKFLLVKGFEKIKDKKSLTTYLNNPPEYTTITFVHNGVMQNPDSEPYKTLIKNGFMFEAKELKGESLTDWLVETARKKGKELSRENAHYLMEISGENRALLEDQLEKIFVYLGQNIEIDFTSIKMLSTALKEFTIFDLQEALGKKNKEQSVRILYNLLDHGVDPVFIVAMLTKYFTGLSRINEMKEKMPDAQAARVVGTHQYYYKNYLAARQKYSDKDLFRALNALLKADIQQKTTSSDPKSLFTLFVTEVLN